MVFRALVQRFLWAPAPAGKTGSRWWGAGGFEENERNFHQGWKHQRTARGELLVSLGLMEQGRGAGCLGSPREPCRARAAHGSCTLGTAGSMWRKGTSPPSPPERLQQTDHDQTPGGREPGRGGPQGSGPKKSSGGQGRCRPTGS